MAPLHFQTKELAEQHLERFGFIQDDGVEPSPIWVSENGLICAQVVRDINSHGAPSYHLEYYA